MALKRINKEFKDFYHIDQQNAIELDPEDPYHWTATIQGPRDSPYEGGLFKVDVKFPRDYPFKPPKMHFITPIYHPNVNEKG